ncbi:hypothetical protein HDU76_010191 [Blyttiomyces sp. JEL0837]|nr:hypothetical protein HDU76_010191 [Blyttiomyces sp. JEL0837]
MQALCVLCQGIGLVVIKAIMLDSSVLLGSIYSNASIDTSFQIVIASMGLQIIVASLLLRYYFAPNARKGILADTLPQSIRTHSERGHRSGSGKVKGSMTVLSPQDGGLAEEFQQPHTKLIVRGESVDDIPGDTEASTSSGPAWMTGGSDSNQNQSATELQPVTSESSIPIPYEFHDPSLATYNSLMIKNGHKVTGFQTASGIPMGIVMFDDEKLEDGESAVTSRSLGSPIHGVMATQWTPSIKTRSSQPPNVPIELPTGTVTFEDEYI